MTTATKTHPDVVTRIAASEGLMTPEAIDEFIRIHLGDGDSPPTRPGKSSDRALAKLLAFCRDTNCTLGGITLKELITEGRR